MKIDISSRRIDQNRLLSAIQDYELKNNQSPYLVMSAETAHALKREKEDDDEMHGMLIYDRKHECRGFVATFKSYTMLCDNDLEFGVVDLR